MKMQEDEIATGGRGPVDLHASPEVGSDAGGRVDGSLDYMLGSLDRPLQVATLAALAKTSPSHFFSLFKRRTGYAPISLFNHLRIRRACELLDDTSLKIKEVAAAVGYNDQLYFSRAFKLLARVAPTEYRQLAPQMRAAIREALVPMSHFLRAAVTVPRPSTHIILSQSRTIDTNRNEQRPIDHQLIQSKGTRHVHEY